MIADIAPTRALALRIAGQFGRRGLLGAVGRTRPDVVVSTYPGTTEALARARRSGHLPVPLVAVITDLAALRFWASPGADLHLVSHPESIPEVHAIAGRRAEVVAARGFNPAGFAQPPSRAAARRELGLPAGGPVVLVSGGGWGVGDVDGAVATALAIADCRVLVLCGTNEGLRSRMEALHGTDPCVRVLGFTDAMPQLMAAADVLVHSTAGLTILEAAICGCHAISFGWGRGHIRANNRAFAEHRLAHVAPDRAALARLLRECLAHPREPDPVWPTLPWAADVLIERYG